MGTAIGKGFAGMGCEVIFYDVVDKDLPNFSKDINYAVENSDVSFICVPTPTVEKKIDLRYIKEAARNIGNALALQQSYHVVVIKSTVLPTTTEKIIIPILEKSGKKVGEEIGVCMNPEFLTEIEGSWTEDKEYKRDFFAEDRNCYWGIR